MRLSGMRALGVSAIIAYCEAQGFDHEATVDVSALSDEMPVPDVALKLRCSACGGRRIKTVPAWHTNPRMTKPGLWNDESPVTSAGRTAWTCGRRRWRRDLNATLSVAPREAFTWRILEPPER
jgi:hypothetical protein